MRAVLLILASLLAFQANALALPKTQLKVSGHKAPGYCEIEVLNQSHKGAFVDILYDNNTRRNGNYVSPGYALEIPLYYGNYCHQYAYLNIYSPEHYLLFSGYAYVGHTLTITSTMSKMSVKRS